MTNAKPGAGGSGTRGSASLPGSDPLPQVPLVVCASAEETRELGGRFAAALPSGAVLSLEGPLGAGKTQFVKGFAAARGEAGEVSSPTFTLVHEYAGAGLAHFDWYRLERAEEVLGLGWEDYLEGGETLLVEWGDKFPELLPGGTWRLRFALRGEARAVTWEARE